MEEKPLLKGKLSALDCLQRSSERFLQDTPQMWAGESSLKECRSLDVSQGHIGTAPKKYRQVED